MKQTRQNGYQFAALCAVSLALVGSAETPAAAAEFAPRSVPKIASTASLQLAQLAGECRAAKRSIFVYRDRSNLNPLEGLTAGERVILQEEDKNNGWIAVRVMSSGVAGFVQTPDLRNCNGATAPPTASPQFPPSTRRPNSVAGSNSNNSSPLCRQVIYRGVEGMAVRSAPSAEATRVGGLAFGDRILIDPASTQISSQGREWVRLTSPLQGWMSNGFPAFPGDRNLGRCAEF